MKTWTTQVGSVSLKSPLLAASGTWSYGLELLDHPVNDSLGAIVTKSLSLKPSLGNPTPRLYETNSGMLNAIGLQNIGIHAFLKDVEPKLKKAKRDFVLSIYANQEDDFYELAELSNQSSALAVELNISCPNIDKGGLEFSSEPKTTERIVKRVKSRTKKPLWVKLSPNVTSIDEIAVAAEAGGADGLSMINTILGMAMDVDRERPVLGNLRGGLSGPAIRPIAVERIYRTYKKVRVPIIGIGGICNARDVLEFILAGATAVQIGTWNFREPNAATEILEDLSKYLSKKGESSLVPLVGRGQT